VRLRSSDRAVRVADGSLRATDGAVGAAVPRAEYRRPTGVLITSRGQPASRSGIETSLPLRGPEFGVAHALLRSSPDAVRAGIVAGTGCRMRLVESPWLPAREPGQSPGRIPPVTPVDWAALWRNVAARVAAHRAAGRGHLLTEDIVRLEAVLALEEVGVGPERVAIEVPSSVLVKGKLDLVIDPPDGVVAELKYPRDSRTGVSPDTMTLGELLRDFLRVAAVAGDDRWVVQLLNDRLVDYLIAAFARYDLGWATAPGDVLELRPQAIAALTTTAKNAIGAAAVPGTVTATFALREPVGQNLSLFAYRVDPLSPGAGPPVEAEAPEAPELTATRIEPAVAASRDGARREILEAARAVVARGGGSPFTLPEVIAEMNRRGTGYAEATIRTMISAHLCAESTGDGVAIYADFTRVGRGLYRFRRAESSPEDLRPPSQPKFEHGCSLRRARCRSWV